MIVKDAICFRNTSGRSSPRRRCTRRSRSHARWAGRAAARPQSKPRCGGGGRATFGSGGARKYGCDQTGCGGVSVVEQPASLIGALNYRTTSRPTSDKASKRSLSRAEPKVRIQFPPAESPRLAQARPLQVDNHGLRAGVRRSGGHKSSLLLAGMSEAAQGQTEKDRPRCSTAGQPSTAELFCGQAGTARECHVSTLTRS